MTNEKKTVSTTHGGKYGDININELPSYITPHYEAQDIESNDFYVEMKAVSDANNAPPEDKSEQQANEAEQYTLQNKKRPLETVNLSLCSGEHYLENFPPSFDWLLKDSLRNACIGLVVAPPGAGKGQFCIQLVTALAAGLPCLGTWTPTQRAKTVYLSAEDDTLILHRRLFHTLKSLPYETQELAASNVYAIPVSGDVGLYDPNTGKTTQHFADLKTLIATHRPQVLIVDTLVRFLPINENDNPSMSKALGFIEELCLEFGCNIVFVHHTAKTTGALATDAKELTAGLEQTALRGFTAATAFLADCQAAFLKSTEAVAAICAQRYIGDQTALACGLGWNDRDRYFTREAWGFPILQGREKILLPRGIVIATRRKSGVVGLTVRCTDDRPKDRPKYWQVVGSSKVPFVVGGTGQSVVLLESALDVILTWQEGEGRVACVATMGSSKPLDGETKTFIERAPLVICTPDNDEAGHAAWTCWRKEFPKAVRIAPVGGKDLGDAHKLATAQHMRGEQRTAPFVGEWLRIALKIARERLLKAEKH